MGDAVIPSHPLPPPPHPTRYPHAQRDNHSNLQQKKKKKKTSLTVVTLQHLAKHIFRPIPSLPPSPPPCAVNLVDYQPLPFDSS